jgi:serine O-acetyltransferase
MSPSPGAFRRFASAVSADYALLRQNQQKYHGHDLAPWKLPIQIAQKIGLQMTAATRVMHLVRDLRVPFGGEVMSRMIRHVYGAEIHFNADIAPGLSIVHGNGLVVSHRAKVGRNCILFHNVTLGESRDSRTGEVGAPVLEDNVHVGPGAVLLGPITIGTGSKIMANAVVTESVPPHSVVRAPAVEIVKRPNKSQTEEA